MRACVYTAIFGGYDTLKPAPAQSVATDFVCYTDGEGVAPGGGWRLCRDRRQAALPARMRSKWFKTHPHVLFPRGRPGLRHNRALALRHPWRHYDATIWIDGSIALGSAHFVRDMLACLEAAGRGAGLAMLRHPDRDCIYDEAAESVKWRKYAGLPIMAQAAAYRAEGYPAHRGLMATGILACRTDWPPRAALFEAWWRENVLWTYQDQLSLPVVQWRQGVSNAWVDGHLWFNPWYTWVPHRREEGPAADAPGA